MHRYTTTILVLFMGFLMTAPASAQVDSPIQDQGSTFCQFIDEDGDGFNDLAPDADGDGIPNGLDPDYVPLHDGEGKQHQWEWIDGLLAKVFAYSLNENMNGNSHNTVDGAGMSAGPGTSIGFGPGASSGSGTSGGSGSGESQAEHAGRRGGRR